MTRNGYVGLQSADLIRTYQLPSNRRLRSNLRSTRVVLGHTQWVHLRCLHCGRVIHTIYAETADPGGAVSTGNTWLIDAIAQRTFDHRRPLGSREFGADRPRFGHLRNEVSSHTGALARPEGFPYS